MASLQRAPAKRRFKRVLVVRHLAAQTAWLHTSPHWHEGRVCWPFCFGNQMRWLPAGANELAAAERALNKIANYPRALETAFGTDHQSGSDWLQGRRRQLEIVKRLARLNAPDLSALARPSYARNPATLQRLTDLLLAEAICGNALPHSPAAILSRWPDDISALLIAFGSDKNLPEATRALVFLVMGARQQKLMVDTASFERLAWQWGRDNGIPDTPGIVARLLLEKEGTALATRLRHVLPTTQRLGFDIEFWSEMLARHSAYKVVALMQKVASCETTVAYITRPITITWSIPKNKIGAKLQVSLEQLRNEQDNARVQLLELLKEFTLAGDAEIIQALQGLVLSLWNLESVFITRAGPSLERYPQRNGFLSSVHLHLQIINHVLLVLTEVQSLSLEKRAAAFGLLQENFAGIWNIESFAKWSQKRDVSKHAQSRLNHAWHERGKPILQLLHCVDEETARQAIALKVERIIAYHRWRDPALAQWAIELSQVSSADIQSRSGRLHDLCSLLAEFSNLATARAVFGPIFEALRTTDAKSRPVLFSGIISHLNWEKNTRHSVLRLRNYLAIIARLATVSQEDETDWRYGWDIAYFAGAARMLDTQMRRTARTGATLEVPEDSSELAFEIPNAEVLENEITSKVKEWLNWMASDILRTRPQSDESSDPVIYGRLETATLSSWILSEGEFIRFQKAFSVAARHNLEDEEYLKRALASLQNYPAARLSLSYLFSKQPTRIMSLLKRWGLASRLSDVQKPLDVFRETPTAVPLAWRDLLQLAPQSWHLAALLAHAQNVFGQTPTLPPGLRRVLEMPHRMESERVHLALRHKQTPRADWAARLEMLQKRLTNRSELQRVMAQEICEKLQDVAMHTMLEAIERQVGECYRARLREVAGPLPPGLLLDEDWMNAVLLTADVEYNRKLLRNLLRALLGGESQWHTTHPANTKFLQELEARNVQTKTWLGTLPRRYKTNRGTWHLRLESHPLAILQMGNYFDTCLSFGGINSFSTVANACELNKRVIFARDEKGRVVGRKLIGLNEDGKLIGFYTYTSLQDTKANQELRRCFARYCEIFAERCGLEMAEEGTIPRLFAEQWYDDGVVKWRGEDETPTRKLKSQGKRTINSHATTSSLVAKRS